MTYHTLGKTRLKVSKLCFGTLTLSPLQRNLCTSDSVKLLKTSFDSGVNFYDTAELYDNYKPLAEAFSGNDDVIIATKCYAYDAKTAEASLNKALFGLKRDTIDIFLLHEQESALTLKGHKEAVDFFIEKKRQGVIKAFGISTHHIAGVNAANVMQQIDVIHAITNKNGFGIVDGTNDEMNEALKRSKALGKGIYGMKPLGGGHLIKQRASAFDYVLKHKSLDAIAVGIQNEAELNYNLAVFNGLTPTEKQTDDVDIKRRELFIHHDWCMQCGQCIKRCQQDALTMQDNRVRIDKEKCVLCSYCASVCKELAIKVL